MHLTPRFGQMLILPTIGTVILLSALGFRNQVVWNAAAFGLLPILVGAVAWIFPARYRRDFRTLTRQRNTILACLALLLSVPLTRWPLEVSIQLARPTLERLRSQALQQAPNYSRTPRCIMGLSDEELELIRKFQPRSFFRTGWIVRYRSRNPLLREVRLWHDGESYVLCELQTHFGVVLRGKAAEDDLWEITD